jgi:hypothetical protein
MPSLNRTAVTSQFTTISGNSEGSSTKLHSVMLEAKRIRMAHAAGELSAEEAAEKLAELYHVHRFKSHRRDGSLLSA